MKTALTLLQAGFRTPIVALADIDRSRLTWKRDELDRALLDIWRHRERAMIVACTVRNLRAIAALRRRWDRRGWSVRTQSQLGSDTIAVYVRVKYRGNRPARGTT